jgi:hypothetical protein
MLELEIIKNPKGAANLGKTYGQDVEPKGTYVIKSEGFTPEGWLEGKAMLNNPLFIDVDSNNLVEWKYELAEKMKAKGSKLTNKLISKGYDAIVTKYSDGGYGEIILFSNAKFYLNKKEMKESRIYTLMETYKKMVKEIYNVPTEIELSNEQKQFIRNINWNDLIIEQENEESPIDFHISIKGMDDIDVSEGIKVSFQIIGDALYQIHINLAKDLQGLGLGYKIYKALIYEFGHVYSGRGRQQNTEEVPKIWQKLSSEPDFTCNSTEIGSICVLNSNPDKNELLNFLV